MGGKKTEQRGVMGKMLTPEEVSERDPVVLQRYLLDLQNLLEEEQADLVDAIQQAGEAKSRLDVKKAVMKDIKNRISIVQSVLRTVT